MGGIFQSDQVSGGSPIVTARNGLTKVAPNIVELGGRLIHDTEIDSVLGALYKLGLLDTPFYIRGSLGFNPITGAGIRLAYDPSTQCLYFGSATAAEFDKLPLVSLIIGDDLQQRNSVGTAIYLALTGKDSEYTPSSQLAMGTLDSIQGVSLFNALVALRGAGAAGAISINNSVGTSNNNTLNGSIDSSLFQIQQGTAISYNINRSIINLVGLIGTINIIRSILSADSSSNIDSTDSLGVLRSVLTGTNTILRSVVQCTPNVVIPGGVGNLNLTDTWLFGWTPQPNTIQSTRCHYFIPNYQGAALNETDKVRYQTGTLAPALKLNLADPKASVGTETDSGFINVGAGVATKPVMQLTPGVVTSNFNNSLQYTGEFFYLRTNTAAVYTKRRSRVVQASVEPFILGATNISGTILHCLDTRNITLSVAGISTTDTLRIKDGNGTAGATPITITAPGGTTINGVASIQITTNYGSTEIYYDGTNFFTI